MNNMLDHTFLVMTSRHPSTVSSGYATTSLAPIVATSLTLAVRTAEWLLFRTLSK